MLEIDGLARRYGDVEALRDVSFSVPPGRIVGFVGRNGSGKTTTMRIVMGLVRPDRGEVRWKGRAADWATRARFGYMPEERGLYPRMRVTEQLAYFAELSGLARGAARAATDRWIERLGLSELANATTDDLSLGCQQRVQLATALVHSPELLVLDEPFGGLDPVGVDVLAETLKSEADAGAAVVFSSHQLELVERLCDDVVIIERGTVVEDAAGLRETDAGRRVLVDVRDASADWASGIVGVRVLERSDFRLLLALDAVDPTVVLDAARAAGRVELFQVGAPSLSERFRDAVRSAR